ncbi:hypothetical protein M422DRAFT_253995 [Sphaerobolus stellatus SS14]|uniref:Uncharacterized protein n=1 Tax=Sphaerobolus stellatus (strain SS14) TaxID=990650 RepID=A0A0C9VM73_SPHS4|nr:hypothetical protein M422DRAFT_253995 [Sphaerobolus stellatus SS14]
MEEAGTYHPYLIMLDRSLACIPHCSPGFSRMKLGRCQGTNGSEEGYVEERNALWSGSAMVAKKAGTGAGGDQNGDEEDSNEAIPYPISSKPAGVQISSGVAGMLLGSILANLVDNNTLYLRTLQRKIVDIDDDEVTTMLPPRTVPTIAAAPNHPRLHISDVVSYLRTPTTSAPFCHALQQSLSTSLCV